MVVSDSFDLLQAEKFCKNERDSESNGSHYCDSPAKTFLVLTEVIRYRNKSYVSKCNENLKEADVLEKHAFSNNFFDLKIFKALHWLDNQEVV